jgi:hypothetical protein
VIPWTGTTRSRLRIARLALLAGALLVVVLLLAYYFGPETQTTLRILVAIIPTGAMFWSVQRLLLIFKAPRLWRVAQLALVFLALGGAGRLGVLLSDRPGVPWPTLSEALRVFTIAAMAATTLIGCVLLLRTSRLLGAIDPARPGASREPP